MPIQPIILSDIPLVLPEFFAIMTIIQEAESESISGQVAVGEVIRKRTKDRIFSTGTLVSTCLAPYQFSGWNTKDPNRIRVAQMSLDDPAVTMAIKAWKMSKDSNLSKGATHYLNPKLVPILPEWAKLSDRVTIIGNHNFYLVP